MEINPEVIKLTAQFLSGAFVGILVNWLQDNDPHPPEMMGEYITQAIRPLLRTAICNGELDLIFN